MIALIIVDYQYDFLPGGALGVPDGDEIADNIINLGRAIESNDGLVVFTQDWHPSDHCSFSDDPQYMDGSWPVHCVQGTHGAEIERRVRNEFPDAPVVQKGADPNREAYSGFDNELLSTTILQDYDHVYVVGLATDYCVFETALDAYGEGFETIIVPDATMPVAWTTGAEAMYRLGRFNGNGMNIASTEEVLQRMDYVD